jgi:AcrR family transcriptional regulator
MRGIMEKKKEIIKSAYELFSEKGYNLSMSEIANAVKIKTPSLYSHFSSKKEIVEIMIKEEIKNYYDNLEKTIEKVKCLNSKECLQEFLLSVLNYLMQDNRLMFWKNVPMIQNRDLEDKCKKLIQEQDIIYNKQIRQWFEKGIASGEIREAVGDGAFYLYFVMIQGLLDGMLFHQNSAYFGELAMKVFYAYWDGISTDNDSSGYTD